MIPATASSAIVRKSHASASSNAPPSAAPWIWQIVGFGISSSRFHHWRMGRRNSRRFAGLSDSARRSFRSMPGGEQRPLAAHDDHPDRVVGRRGLDAPRPSERIASPFNAFRFSGRFSTSAERPRGLPRVQVPWCLGRLLQREGGVRVRTNATPHGDARHRRGADRPRGGPRASACSRSAPPCSRRWGWPSSVPSSASAIRKRPAPADPPRPAVAAARRPLIRSSPCRT